MASLHNRKLVSKVAMTATIIGCLSAMSPAFAVGPGTPPPPPPHATGAVPPPPPPPPAKVTVDANGSVSVKPDMALLQVSVSHEAATAKEAADQTNSDLKKVLSALEKYKLADRDMQSNGMMVNTVYHREEGQKEPTKSFQAQTSLDLKIRDTQQLGSIIDDSIANGATGVSDISWTNSNLEPLYREAREKAVKNAMEKTRTYAQAAGLSTGRVLTIDETSGEVPAPRFYARAQSAMVMAADTPVAQGEKDYSVRVTVTQELLDTKK